MHWRTLQIIVFAIISIPVVIYDIREYRIPDVFVIPGIGAAMLISYLSGTSLLMSGLGIACISGILLLARQLTKGKLGLGDVKYSIFICGCVGLVDSLFSLFLAVGFGLLTYLIYAIGGNRKMLERPLPFAPYLGAGTMCIIVLRQLGISLLTL